LRNATAGWSSAALLIVSHQLRRRSAHFDLIADLLHNGSQRFDLLLLLRDFRPKLLLLIRKLSLEVLSLFFHPAVLFEELVEQHRVHRFVANGEDFPFGVAHHQVRL
jgi:hypothetical protein